MRLTPGQIAFRNYIGMGTPLHRMSKNELRELGIEWFNSVMKSSDWPRDSHKLYRKMAEENIGGFTFEDGHLHVMIWMKVNGTA